MARNSASRTSRTPHGKRGLEMNVDLEPVNQYRRATRQILRHPSFDTQDRSTALMNLIRDAREQLLADLIIHAMTAEVSWSIDREDKKNKQLIGDPMERRHRQMRGRGF